MKWVGRLSRPARAVLSISTATAAGQLVVVAASPLLTRLYTPRDLGLLAVVTALVSALVPIMSMRLELAIPLPPDEDDAQSLAGAALVSCLGFTVVCTVAALLLADQIADLLGDPALAQLLWAVPLIAAATAGYLVLNQLAIRHRRYRAVARRNLVMSVSTVFVQLLAGLASLRASGLVLGLGVGRSAGLAALLAGSGLGAARLRGATTWTAMRDVVSSYRRFPLMLAPAGLLNVLGLQAPVLMMAALYGTDEAGWLGLTQRVLALPVTLIGMAVAQVFLGEFSDSIRSGGTRARRLFDAATTRLLAVATVGAALLLALGPMAFAAIFGAEWQESGQFARALALGLAAQLVASPVSQTLIVLGHTGTQLLWDAGRLLLVVAVIAIAWAIGAEAITAMWWVGLSQLLTYAGGWLLSRRAIGRHRPISGGE